ncbi:MAG: 16S rRNA (guanine(527)-N(7))-methyltransferase RsmG [Acidobacteriota bacterium]
MPFSESEVQQFLLYYELVLKWNQRLHLTTLVDPALFFQRHLLESDFAASLIEPIVTHLWDLGSGLGVPGIPIAVLRPDLFISLVEAKRNKAVFLEEVVDSLGLMNIEIFNSKIESLGQFSEGDCIMARAVEQMGEMVPAIIKIGVESSQLLLFGSISLAGSIKPYLSPDFQMKAHQIPDSDRRQVFNITRST